MLPSSMSKVTQQLPCKLVLASYLLLILWWDDWHWKLVLKTVESQILVSSWYLAVDLAKPNNLYFDLLEELGWIVDCKLSVTSCIILTGTNRSWESENGGSRKVLLMPAKAGPTCHQREWKWSRRELRQPRPWDSGRTVISDTTGSSSVYKQ